jgi:tetratricopeptide (TPR) repeat protein
MDGTTSRLVARARERLDAGDAYGAIHFLKEALATGKAFADAHNLLGLATAAVGQREEALAEFDRALALNPHYVDALLNRAVTLNDLGRYDEAAAAFGAAQGLAAVDHTGFEAPVASQLANLHAQLGEAYVEAGGIPQAIDQYERAARLRPEYPDLRYRLARLRLEAGQIARARVDLEAILELRPDFFDARVALGMACHLLGDAAAARTAWDHCRRDRPEDARVAAYLALLARVSAATAGDRRGSPSREG